METSWREWIIYCVALLFLLFYINRWYWTWHILRRHTFKLALSTLLLSCKTFKLYTAFGGVVLLLLSPIIFLLGISPSVAAWCWICSLSLFTVASQPAIVLFLGNSNAETITLRKKIVFSISPLRSISLLNAEKSGDFDSRSSVIFDNSSVFDEQQWLSYVDKLTEIIPFIVMDLRILSKSVRYELNLVVQTKRSVRALFHVGFTGMEELLYQKGINENQIFKNDEELLQYLGLIMRILKASRNTENGAIVFGKVQKGL